MTSKDEIRRVATIAAIDDQINRLTYGLPLGIVGGVMGYAMAGPFGLLGVTLLGGYALKSAYQSISRDKWAIQRDDQATLIKYTPKPNRDKLREAYAVIEDEPAPTVATLPPPQPSTEWQPATFNRDELLEGGTGLIVLGDSGSGKSTLCRYLAEGLQNAPLLVLDPHFDPTRNPWGEAMVINNSAAICTALEKLLGLLDEGDRRPLTVIVDEVPSLRVYAKQEGLDIVDRFIVRFGSECRKFNKLAILCSQSGNVKSLGLEGQGDFLMNYTQIALGKIAVKRLHNSTARDAYRWAQTVAYPVLIDDHITTPHPNLGGYSRRGRDNQPMGLGAIAPPPLYPDVLAAVSHHPKHITGDPCPHCGSTETIANGTAPNGDRRRKCKSCGKTCGTQRTKQNITGDPCPHCGSTETIANGHSPGGIPRRKCKACGKTFDAPSTTDPLVWGV